MDSPSDAEVLLDEEGTEALVVRFRLHQRDEDEAQEDAPDVAGSGVFCVLCEKYATVDETGHCPAGHPVL